MIKLLILFLHSLPNIAQRFIGRLPNRPAVFEIKLGPMNDSFSCLTVYDFGFILYAEEEYEGNCFFFKGMTELESFYTVTAILHP